MTDSEGPLASIIIVNYNGRSLLADCVQSVRRYTSSYEIIVVDNASRDDSVDMVEPGPDLRVIRLAKNTGFASASNIGIKASKSRNIVFLNSDTIVAPSWLDKLISVTKRYQKVGIVNPKLVRPGGRPWTLDSTGHVYFYGAGLVYSRGHNEPDSGQFDKFAELISCGFACVLIKREVFEQVGLLDERMLFYYEDVDFGIRARIAGWRILYCPESVVYHVGAGSTHENTKRILEVRSRAYALRVILKNYEAKAMILYGGRWILLDFLRVIAGIKNRDWQYAASYAHSFAWNAIHPAIGERVIVQRTRKLRDKEIFAFPAGKTIEAIPAVEPK
jgi:GT2 family glycosyltransferase